jgi:hypothetical protein
MCAVYKSVRTKLLRRMDVIKLVADSVPGGINIIKLPRILSC